MRKAFTDTAFIITVLLAVTIAISSFVIIKKTDGKAPAKTEESCSRPTPSKMDALWEAFPRQFVTSVFFR